MRRMLSGTLVTVRTLGASSITLERHERWTGLRVSAQATSDQLHTAAARHFAKVLADSFKLFNPWHCDCHWRGASLLSLSAGYSPSFTPSQNDHSL